MKVLQPVRVGQVSSIKNAKWEIRLTDSSFGSEFGFSKFISDKYITTNIQSPLGEKHVLYNTVSGTGEIDAQIELNFEEIDQTRVGVLSFKSEPGFFDCWKMELRDNRSGHKIEIKEEADVLIEPIIEFNRLRGYGFVKSERTHKSPLELHLSYH